MDVVDNIDDAQPTEQVTTPDESVVGKPFTKGTFNDAWRGAYLHLTETLRRIYEQVGTAVDAEMTIQFPDFNPDTSDEDKSRFEDVVTQRVVATGAQDALLGMLKMGLVVYLDIGKRYGFETKDIVATLQELTKDTDVNQNLQNFLKETRDGNEVQEPVRTEEASS